MSDFADGDFIVYSLRSTSRYIKKSMFLVILLSPRFLFMNYTVQTNKIDTRLPCVLVNEYK